MKLNSLMIAVLLSYFLIGPPLCGCKKKYPEDPKKTCESPASRIDGSWKLIYYYFNNVSIYSTLNSISNGSTNLDNCWFRFQRNEETKDFNLQISGLYYDHRVDFPNQEYILIDNSQKSVYSKSDSLFSYWFISPFHYNPKGKASWRITKLYKNNLNLVLKTDSGDYKMYFDKVEK